MPTGIMPTGIMPVDSGQETLPDDHAAGPVRNARSIPIASAA